MTKIITVVIIAASSVFALNLPMKVVTVALPANNPAAQAVSGGAIVKAAVPTAAVVAPVNTKSFKEWKNEKVQMAIKRVTITKAQIEYRRLNKQFIQKAEPSAIKDLEIERLESQLKNDLYSLEVTQELNVTDYFAIYLTKQENKSEAYQDAAEKMTPDEVGQLIKAYADSMFSTNGNGSPAIKVKPTAMEKSDDPK